MASRPDFRAGRKFAMELALHITVFLDKRLLDLLTTEEDEETVQVLKDMRQRVSSASAVGRKALEKIKD
jgi:hypothetical protein